MEFGPNAVILRDGVFTPKGHANFTHLLVRYLWHSLRLKNDKKLAKPKDLRLFCGQPKHALTEKGKGPQSPVAQQLRRSRVPAIVMARTSQSFQAAFEGFRPL